MLDLASHFGVSRHSRKLSEGEKKSNFYAIRRRFYFANRGYSRGKHQTHARGIWKLDAAAAGGAVTSETYRVTKALVHEIEIIRIVPRSERANMRYN